MKILHLIGIGKLPRDPDREAAGGLTRVALEMAELQAAQGHRVVVAVVGRVPWRAVWRGVVLVSVRAMPRLRLRLVGRKLDLSTLVPLLLLSLRHRFDVIHSHEYNCLRYLPAGIRITHFHNDPFRFSLGEPAGDWEARECLTAARYSHAHVAVSRFVGERLRLRYQSIASALPPTFDAARRIHVIHNGVNMDHFDPDKWQMQRRRLRRSWHVGDQEVVFLYCGAIAPSKGVLELARAFIDVAKVVPAARLVLAGGAALWQDQHSLTGANSEHADYQQAVREALSRLADVERVIHLGLVAPNALPGIYAASDVVVIPSIVQEAFCLTAAEALAMRKPLVACRVGGMVEFAGETNCLFVPAGDRDALCKALCAIGHDHDLRERLGRTARRSVSSYTWSSAVGQLNRLYADLLARKESIQCAPPPPFYQF